MSGDLTSISLVSYKTEKEANWSVRFVDIFFFSQFFSYKQKQSDSSAVL